MHGEKESLNDQRLSKDHSWRIAENSWVSGQKTLKKKNVKQPLHHHMLFGRVSRKIHIQLSDTTGTSNGTGFYGQMKLKN